MFTLVTGIHSNIENVLMPLTDKLLLQKRAIAETIISQLKNISQIEHSRHRSPINFLVNLICGLIAYCRQLKKPAVGAGILPALIAQPELTERPLIESLKYPLNKMLGELL